MLKRILIPLIMLLGLPCILLVIYILIQKSGHKITKFKFKTKRFEIDIKTKD